MCVNVMFERFWTYDIGGVNDLHFFGLTRASGRDSLLVSGSAPLERMCATDVASADDIAHAQSVHDDLLVRVFYRMAQLPTCTC